MTEMVVCDRCGKEMPKIKLGEHNILYLSGNRARLHFCEDCIEELLEWMDYYD